MIDRSVGLRPAGIMFGAITGLALAVLVTIAKATRDPNATPPSYFIQLHGWGSRLIGRSDIRKDRSYVATEWFTIVWIPVFPVCRYRVIQRGEAGNPFHQEYTILEKMPPLSGDIAKGHAVFILWLLLAVGFACSIFQ